MAHSTHLGHAHADHSHVDQEIRAFNLVSEPALDDREVEELARSVAFAGILGGEALGALTRRECTLSFGDLLVPIDPAIAETRKGVRFSVVSADESAAGLGVFFLSESAAVALADIFFGGPGEGSERRLTDIEARSITTSVGGVIAPVLGVVTGREGCRVDLAHVKRAELPGDDLVELSVIFTIAERTVEASLFVQNPDGMTGAGSSREIMVETVRELPVHVDVDLAQVEMAATDVQALADGDVIVFDASPDGEVTLRSGENELLRGRVGERSGHRLLEVTEVLVSS